MKWNEINYWIIIREKQIGNEKLDERRPITTLLFMYDIHGFNSRPISY